MLKANDLAEVKESALRLLARREHGAFELKQKLQERGFDLSAIDTVLLLFKNLDLQSDKRFVENYIRIRAAKGFGPLHITHELLKIRVSEQLIADEMEHYHQGWDESIKQLCFKKFGSMFFLQDLKKRAKQIRFFQARGFSLGQIKVALVEK